jgi:hypothetical protein
MERNMRLNFCKKRLTRLTASFVLVAYCVSCTNMPSGEKAFNSFETCFAANLGLAAAGGVGAGLLTSKLAERLSGSTRTGQALGAAAGVAAGAMIAMTAWKKCGAVYNTSVAIVQPSDNKAQDAPVNRKPGLNLEQLSVKLAGTENDAPSIEFDFSYFADNVAAKDVKVKFRHKVEIVRFRSGNNEQLVLADDNGNALLDASGNQIALEQASKMPRDKLHWVTIAEEGHNDYVEDVIIQQGSKHLYSHRLQVPPRDKFALPLPVPMRYSLTVEAGTAKSKRSVDFSLLEKSQRPKLYNSGASINSGDLVVAPVEKRSLGDPVASKQFTFTHIVTKKVTLMSDTSVKQKNVAVLEQGTKVSLSEKQEVMASKKTTEWAKVSTESKITGWLRSSDLLEVR